MKNDSLYEVAPTMLDVRMEAQSQVQPNSGSGATSSGPMSSRQAVIDGFNLKQEKVKYQNVKGFKQKTHANDSFAQKPQQLEDEVVFSSLDIGKNRQSHKTLNVEKNTDANKFSSELQISHQLMDSLNRAANIKIEDQAHVQSYLKKQGILMFDEHSQKMHELRKPFDDKNERNEGEIGVVQGEKFQIENEHDYK